MVAEIVWIKSAQISSVHKHSAGAGAGAGIVRVRPTLKFHISGAQTLRDTLRKDNIELFSNHVCNVHPFLLASCIWKSRKYFFNLKKK